MATGSNKNNKFRAIGLQIEPLRSPTEGSDAHGRPTLIVKEEAPTRIDEVNGNLIYCGWAEFGSLENDPIWKIKKTERVGGVWKQTYVDGNQFYRSIWDDRSILNYS